MVSKVMNRILVVALLIAIASTGLTAQQRFGVNAGQGVQIDYTNPRVFEIADIKFTGLKTLDERALVSYTGIKVGDRIPIPGREISEAIRKLWDQGVIADVSFWLTRVEGDQAYLEVKLQERPRILSYAFEGINNNQRNELGEQLGVEGRVASAPVIKNSELLIKKFFVGKGYLNATVKTVQNRDTVVSDGVRLNFIVDKKTKVKINRISFEGNDSFSRQRLKKTLKNTHEKPRFWLVNRLVDQLFKTKPSKVVDYVDSSYTVSGQEFRDFISNNVKLNFLQGSKFIQNDFDDDTRNLVDFYNSKGYRDAEVIDTDVRDVNGDFIDVDIKIEEGKRYYIRDISWIGNYKYSDDTLATVLGIEKGDVYNQQRIIERTEYDGKTGDDLSSLYMDDGYLFFNLDVVEVRVEDDSVDLEMRIREGEQATIKRIILKGNDRTSDHVVLREIRTLPGQKFSRKALIRTTRELAQLGFFDPEQINPNPIPNLADGTVDIEFDLVEKSSDQIQLSGGFGGPFGFVGTVGLSLNNFSVRNIGDWSKWRPYPSGDGQRLSLQIQSNGRRFRSTSLVFSEPWLGGRKPNNFSVSLSTTANRNITFGTDQVNGFLKANGITVGLGRRLRWPDDYFQISNSLSFQAYSVFNFGNILGFSTGNSNSVTFNTSISRSNIDNPTFPKFGSTFSLNINATPPWSLFNDSKFDPEQRELNGDPALTQQERYKWVEYHKWLMDASFFLPLPGKFVINARVHLGFIGTYSDKTDSGPFERFFLGGNGLNGQNNFVIGQDIIALRGYDDNSIVPVDQVTGFRGGLIFDKFVVELRYPISTAPTSTIFLLGFMEAGNAWNNYEEFTLRRQFRSAGVGARVFLPAFGQLGIDWAYGFDSDPTLNIQSGSQVHFTIGQQIR